MIGIDHMKKLAKRKPKLFVWADNHEVQISMKCRKCGSLLIGNGWVSKGLVTVEVDPCSGCNDPAWLPQLQQEVRDLLRFEFEVLKKELRQKMQRSRRRKHGLFQRSKSKTARRSH